MRPKAKRNTHKANKKHTNPLDQARNLANSGQYTQATQIITRILKENPKDGGAWALFGYICDRNDDKVSALQYYLRAIECLPNEPRYYYNAAQLYLNLADANPAIPLLKKAQELDPHFPGLDYSMGLAYSMIQQLTAAVECLKEALEKNPTHLDALLKLADNYEKMNHLDDAHEILENARTIAPTDPRLLLQSGRLLRRAGKYDDAIAELNASINGYKQRGNIPPKEVIYLAEALNDLAKIKEKLGKYDEAYQSFCEGQQYLHGLHKLVEKNMAEKSMHENVSLDAEGLSGRFFSVINQCKTWFNEEVVSSWPHEYNSNSHVPFFLVGFPRSGTTLSGNILSAHPNVHTLQEEGMIERLSTSMSSISTGNKIDYPETLNLFDENALEQSRQYYWNEVAKLPDCPSEEKLVVDKMPLSTVHLGLIYRLFPTTRILVLIRDPRDACLSCFQQNFNYNPAMSGMCTLEGAINTYHKVMDLYLQYRRILPEENFLEIRYEDLVTDLESHAHNILDFFGLPWSNEVLRYYEADKNTYVTTPSYEAVMKPIYKTSAGRWKNYEQYFAPYMDKLMPFITHFNYT